MNLIKRQVCRRSQTLHCNQRGFEIELVRISNLLCSFAHLIWWPVWLFEHFGHWENHDWKKRFMLLSPKENIFCYICHKLNLENNFVTKNEFKKRQLKNIWLWDHKKIDANVAKDKWNDKYVPTYADKWKKVKCKDTAWQSWRNLCRNQSAN